jgi:hypothetical protein
MALRILEELELLGKVFERSSPISITFIIGGIDDDGQTLSGTATM